MNVLYLMPVSACGPVQYNQVAFCYTLSSSISRCASTVLEELIRQIIFLFF